MAERHLPSSSPALNPIEKAFNRLKAGLRAAARRAVPEVEWQLGELSMPFAPVECRSDFRSCGYSAAMNDREPL